MTTALVSFVDAVAVLAIGCVAVAMLRRRSAALRHAILASAVGCALLMPVLEVVLPGVPVIRWAEPGQTLSSSAVWSSAPFVSTPASTSEPVRGTTQAWWMFVSVVWAAGAIVIGAGLLTGVLRLMRLTSRCAPASAHWQALVDDLAAECGIRRRVALLQSHDPSLLVAFGVFKPTIILPAGVAAWDDDRMRVVLRHELAHVARHDAAIQLAGELLRAVQWINPLAWLACHRLRQESEYACDDAVLRGGTRATDYATHLLDIARHVSASGAPLASAPAIAHPSTLERRIVAMLHEDRNRVPLTRRGWALAGLVALGISIPLAAAGVAPPDDTFEAAPPSTDVTLPAPTVQQELPPPPPPPPPRLVERRAASQAPGTIGGVVHDPSRAVLPGVELIVTESQSGARVTTTTDARGRFQFRNLQPGQYELVARLPGFATVTNRVKLAAGENLDGTLTLPLGSVSETITVACRGPVASVLEWFVPVLQAQDQPPPPPPAPIRVGGNIRPPTKVKDVRPSCPTSPSVDTLVRLTGRIGADGLAFDVQPEPAAAGTAPPQEFVDAAIAAVNAWVFTPTLLNGRAVEVGFKVRVTFTR